MFKEKNTGFTSCCSKSFIDCGPFINSFFCKFFFGLFVPILDRKERTVDMSRTGGE